MGPLRPPTIDSRSSSVTAVTKTWAMQTTIRIVAGLVHLGADAVYASVRWRASVGVARSAIGRRSLVSPRGGPRR